MEIEAQLTALEQQPSATGRRRCRASRERRSCPNASVGTSAAGRRLAALSQGAAKVQALLRRRRPRPRWTAVRPTTAAGRRAAGKPAATARQALPAAPDRREAHGEQLQGALPPRRHGQQEHRGRAGADDPGSAACGGAGGVPGRPAGGDALQHRPHRLRPRLGLPAAVAAQVCPRAVRALARGALPQARAVQDRVRLLAGCGGARVLLPAIGVARPAQARRAAL